MWSALGLLVLCLLLLSGYPLGHGQEESLNFCDIPCVNNIYKFYCGEAKCTTGASDYGQIFQLCDKRCVVAIAGEAMGQCLTVTVPERADWPAVQASVVEEVVDFCAGYDIAVETDLPPLTLEDTDKKLLDTLYDEPEEEEKKNRKGSKKSKDSSKKTSKGKGSRKEKSEEKEKNKETTKKPNQSKKRPEPPQKTKTKTPSVEPESTESKSNKTRTKKESTSPEGASNQEPTVEEDKTVVSDLDDEAVGSVLAEERGGEIEEALEAFEGPK